MTDRERAIVQAHTGCKLLGGSLTYIFVDYTAEVMGHPLTEAELQDPEILEKLKQKSLFDFKKLYHGGWGKR